MLDLNAIKERINDLTDEFSRKLHLLTLKVGTGQDYSKEMYECQLVVSEVAELEQYLEAFDSIKEDE